MKSFKKALRLFGLILLMVLASIGMGIIGGAPIPPTSIKEDTIELQIEFVEESLNENPD